MGKWLKFTAVGIIALAFSYFVQDSLYEDILNPRLNTYFFLLGFLILIALFIIEGVYNIFDTKLVNFYYIDKHSFFYFISHDNRDCRLHVDLIKNINARDEVIIFHLRNGQYFKCHRERPSLIEDINNHFKPKVKSFGFTDYLILYPVYPFALLYIALFIGVSYYVKPGYNLEIICHIFLFILMIGFICKKALHLTLTQKKFLFGIAAWFTFMWGSWGKLSFDDLKYTEVSKLYLEKNYKPALALMEELHQRYPANEAIASKYGYLLYLSPNPDLEKTVSLFTLGRRNFKSQKTYFKYVACMYAANFEWPEARNYARESNDKKTIDLVYNMQPCEYPKYTDRQMATDAQKY